MLHTILNPHATYHLSHVLGKAGGVCDWLTNPHIIKYLENVRAVRDYPFLVGTVDDITHSQVGMRFSCGPPDDGVTKTDCFGETHTGICQPGAYMSRVGIGISVQD